VTGPTTRRRLCCVLLALVAAGVALVGWGAAPASAHAFLVSTTPAQGSRVQAPPRTVTLVFTEEVTLNERSVQVADGRGSRVDDARPQHPDSDSRAVRVGLPAGLAQGSYTVTWRVVSVDGHPVSGTFAFGVGVPAGSAAPAVTVDPLVGAVRTVAQLLSYAGAALLIGGSAFLFLLWPAGHDSPATRRLMIGAVAAAAVGSIGSILIQGPYVAGRGLGGLVDPGLIGETFGSSYGRPLLLRVLAVALSLPVLGIWPTFPDGEDAGPGGVAAFGNAVLLAASFSLTGHAAEASPRLLAETADVVHLAAASVWLGGLAVLVLAFLREADDAQRARVLPRWSRLAMIAVGTVLVTGGYQAWREVQALGAFTGTGYGRLLLGKLVVVVAMLATALAARRWVGSRPTGRGRTAVGVEALLGVAVLGVTSFLVATPPARNTFGPPFSATVSGADVDGARISVVVDVAPTRVGAQSLRLRAFTPTGEPLPFASATGSLTRAGETVPVRITFAATGDGEATATAVVPTAGRWTLTVQVLTDATTDYAATTSYLVR
jgi:copper transport protein